MKNMKILIVITKSELGGAQVFVLNLARGLKAAGVQVVVAGGPGNYLPSELERYNIPFRLFQNLERSRNPFKSLGFISELKEYVAAEKFDVVHLNSTNSLVGAWALSRLKPRPRVIFTVHGLSLLDGGHKAMGILKAAYRSFFSAAFKKIDELVFVSRLNKEFAVASGLLKNGLETKSRLIYNGRDFAPEYLLNREGSRLALVNSLNLTPSSGVEFQNAYLYGSIGRLAYPKNYEFLINVHKAVKVAKPNAKLLLIGEGPEREKYEGLIRSYKLESDIYLTGEIEDASRYLKAFDLFVLPSVFEGLSLSLIEAVRAGVPCLASRVGGNEEIIGVDNCFPLNDQVSFLREFEREELNEEVEEFGNYEKRATVSKVLVALPDFSEQTMINEYLRLYNG